MRKASIGTACLLVMLAAGCAKKDPVLSRIEGAEPQRLSFGTPEAVQKSFTEQMKVCWFSGASPLLSGYQYDTTPATLETGDGLTPLQQVTISSGQGPQAQIFIVQFYPFNDNTLISTRNQSFPVELAARLKRDVETWIFGRGECEEPKARGGYASVPALSPQTSSAGAVQTSASGWSGSQEPSPGSSIR
ncbi:MULTISPECIES: hypothetical protein [Rhodomicrobium]|uniref:hypothetical protein n=1 Tax=Rhodomicrobium TaxID=1068 RepID=UPI000F7360EA|nr:MULTISPECIES: hypothetical protein [Rhodomicrobium]